MTTPSNHILYWLPRVLGLIHGLFLAVFAFDVFEVGSWWEKIAAFLIHLIPTYLVLITVAIGWRRPLLGGLLCIGLALLSVFVVRGEAIAYLLIGGPLLLVGLLFLLDWRSRQQVQLQL